MILITGGAGYIGSHVNKQLALQGRDTLVYDNLVYGHRELVKWGKFIQGDLDDRASLRMLFQTHDIEAVIHLAAYAYVGESIGNPYRYYSNNVVNTLWLLEAMREHGCDKIIFSSTCATYGIPDTIPITENMPQNPINPYGASKLMIERIFQDYAAAYGLKYVVLRYFNAAGADSEGEIGEWHEPETHLIPLVLDAAAGIRSSVKVFGDDYPTQDGTCVRDYIHVSDLANAHSLAYEHLLSGGSSEFFNLGNEQGNSVLAVIGATRSVTGMEIPVERTRRRAGDPAVLIGSSKKIHEQLGWKPQFSDIDSIIRHAWAWHQRRVRA